MHSPRSWWRNLVGTAAALVLLAVLSGCLTINLPGPPGPLKEREVGGSGSAKILLMDLSGVISSAEEDSFIKHPSIVSRVKEELTKAGKDSNVKALVLRINSPGGTVTASDIIYHEIKQFKQKHKIPVVASIVDVGASGGYYIAAAADKILAHPSSVTGSVGVIMLTMHAHDERQGAVGEDRRAADRDHVGAAQGHGLAVPHDDG
jgi:protease-4